MVFLLQVTSKTARRQRNETWRKAAADSLLKEAGTHKLGAYIDKKQTIVTEWVSLIPIYDVCERGMGYSGGGRRRDPWWWKTAARKQLKDMLDEIFAASRERQRKYGRHLIRD